VEQNPKYQQHARFRLCRGQPWNDDSLSCFYLADLSASRLRQGSGTQRNLNTYTSRRESPEAEIFRPSGPITRVRGGSAAVGT